MNPSLAVILLAAAGLGRANPPAGPQTRPAAAPTTKPFDARSEAYFHKLYPLPPAARAAAGRKRAEWDYARGWGELEAYGLRPEDYFDEKTGLYVRWMGCMVMLGEESDAYNQRLRELVQEHGLPANAVGLREKLQKAKQFARNPAGVKWISLPPSQRYGSETGSWLQVGPYKLRRECHPVVGTSLLVRQIQLLNGLGDIVSLTSRNPDQITSAAYWAEENLLILKPDQRPQLLFYDLPYGRPLLNYVDFKPLRPTTRPATTQTQPQ